MLPIPFRLTVLRALTLAVVIACPHLSSATTLTVTNFGDTVPGGATGQLRRLINDAAPGDTIVIPAGTITLTGPAGEHANASGDLDINKNLTIQGAGAGATIIDGGGIDRVFEIFGGNVTISGVTIRHGIAVLFGGGIRNSGNLTLTDAIVSGNTADDAGGGIYNSLGTLTLTSVTLIGNTAAGCCGGGLYNSSGTATLANVTVSGNTGHFNSGGIRNDASMTLTNVTISGNSTSDGGGGVMTGGGTLTLNHVTITNNTGDSDANGTGDGGGLNRNGGTITMRDTIVAGNTGASQAPDCSGPTLGSLALTSEGHNLVGNNTGCSFTSAAGDLVGTGGNPINPQLGPLANNGGPTQTHALLSGSPAINGGTNTDCPATDQRGIARPQGGTCDIGAYEAVIAFDPAPATAFVTRLYQTVLLREPDPAGLAAHVQNIQQFGTVIPTVIAFFKSQEFLSQSLSDTQFLDRLYHTFLNRAPDPAGLNAFLALLQSGCRTRDTLLADLTFSPEFRALLPPITPADPRVPFVAELYAWILTRPADLPGLQSFVSQLQRSTVLSTVQSFLHSAEFTTPRRSAPDYVSALYLVTLSRAPDCGGLASFLAALTPDTDAARDQLLPQFTGSTEFQAKLNQLFP